eukprot:scaffold518_cov388-Prasinococcus_capsulatus_cf.AAC.9
MDVLLGAPDHQRNPPLAPSDSQLQGPPADYTGPSTRQVLARLSSRSTSATKTGGEGRYWRLALRMTHLVVMCPQLPPLVCISRGPFSLSLSLSPSRASVGLPPACVRVAGFGYSRRQAKQRGRMHQSRPFATAAHSVDSWAGNDTAA